jgi:Flp pilus assembly protein TadB
MLIWTLLSLFGLMIVHRTLADCETLQFFSQSITNRVRMFSFLTVILINFFLKDAMSALVSVNIVIFLSPWWASIAIRKHRESALKNQFIQIVDSLILAMRAGKGFKAAMIQIIERSQPAIRYTMSEFMSALQYQKEIETLSLDAQIRFFFQELRQVDLSQHRPVEKLKALRRRLMVEKNFRQKSRQALLQIKFQSWLMTGMYLLVLCYVHFDFGLQNHWGLMLTSAILFSTGLLIIQLMGRRYQWKL